MRRATGESCEVLRVLCTLRGVNALRDGEWGRFESGEGLDAAMDLLGSVGVRGGLEPFRTGLDRTSSRLECSSSEESSSVLPCEGVNLVGGMVRSGWHWGARVARLRQPRRLRRLNGVQTWE